MQIEPASVLVQIGDKECLRVDAGIKTEEDEILVGGIMVLHSGDFRDETVIGI
jgi:hypothetical protein